MSQFEKSLQGIIAQASQDYIKIAADDPVVISTDDGTARGEHLDRILKAQRKEKKELWEKLYSLENKRIRENADGVFNSKSDAVTSTARKQLQALMYQHREINSLVTVEMDKIDTIEQLSDDVLEIEFRENLDKQIQQYEILNRFVNNQLDETTHLLTEEKKVLTECEDVYSALKEKERQLAEAMYVQSYPDQLRIEQELWDVAYKKDTHDLIDFLDEHYPPHAVDDANEMGDECDLKLILEELMNLSVDSPDDPYFKLVPGTYWSPYIQTLVKGGIVEYHPSDAELVRLQDFSY